VPTHGNNKITPLACVSGSGVDNHILLCTFKLFC
jgi:hypothetical protein